MLILSRKEGERIMIGDDIEIILIKSRFGAARIGIKAPRDLPVHRREVYDAIKEALGADDVDE